MTKNEKKTIQVISAKLWNDLQMRSYDLVTKELPRGCGYDVASKLVESDAECCRALSRWCTVNDLMKSLKIEVDYSLYGDHSHLLWCYANGK